MSALRPVIAVSGMAFEAKIARAPGVIALHGLDRAALAAQIYAAAPGAAGIVSFGVCGGLSPELAPGAALAASAILSPGLNFDADAGWLDAILKAAPHARAAVFAGVDAPVISAAAKRDLYALTSAGAVDMESHAAAQAAMRFGLPFAALRVVLDPASVTLPPAALAGMRADGSTDLAAVLASLARNPGQAPALLSLAAAASKARAVLLRSRNMLGPRFAFPYFS